MEDALDRIKKQISIFLADLIEKEHELALSDPGSDEEKKLNAYIELRSAVVNRLKMTKTKYQDEWNALYPPPAKEPQADFLDEPQIDNNYTVAVRGPKLDLPKFNAGYEKNPKIFIKILVNALSVNGVPIDLWRSYLGASLENTKYRMWYAKFVESKLINDWDLIVKMFVDKLSFKDKKMIAIRQINNAKQRDDESSAEYVDRFSELVFDAELDDTDASVLSAFAAGLKHEVKQYFNVVSQLTKIVTLSDAYALLLKLDVDKTEKTIKKKKEVCQICKKKNHSENECWFAKDKYNLEKKVSINKPENNLKNSFKRPPRLLEQDITCYKCKEVGHKANVCPKKAKINAVFNSYSEGIEVPVMVNDSKIYAILDTGADRTCIDLELAKNNLHCSLTS